MKVCNCRSNITETQGSALPDKDPGLELTLWAQSEEDAKALLKPDTEIQIGSVLDVVLRKQDLLNPGASTQRTDLFEKAVVLDLALATSHQSNVKGLILKMIAHQIPAFHERVLELIAEAPKIEDLECLKEGPGICKVDGGLLQSCP